MVTKGDIVRGAAEFMLIWGITSSLTPEEETIMLSTLDDYALELESKGLLTGYMAPSVYGCSSPNDDSGLADWMAGPFKKLLAVEAVTIFGREVSMTLAGISKKAKASLEHALVNVMPAANPATLPKGSGNEWAYRDSKFYNEEPDRIDTETDGSLDDITINNDRIC